MLEGHAVILVPLDPTDISDEYVAWFNDPETFRFLGTKFGQTKSAIRRYVEAIEPPNMMCKIIWKRNDAHVGNIALSGFNPIHRRIELGIVIGRADARGHGIGKEACSLLMQHAFDHLNAHKVTAGTVEANEWMTKAFLSLGFEIEGKLLQHYYLEGQYHTMYRFGVLRENFRPFKGKAG